MANKNTSALLDKLYPIVEKSLKTNISKLKNCIGRYIEKHSSELYEIAPYTRIYYTDDDKQDLLKALNIDEKEITNILSFTYYYPIPKFHPAYAKDEVTVLMMMIIRYFYLKKMKKELEMCVTYTCFTGKFYPSVHYGSFPEVVPMEHKHVMDYVVNTMLSNKYDLKIHGSVIGAVRSIGMTWIDKYDDDEIKKGTDADIVYIVQQLRDRIKSFMINIATLYYDAYDNKDSYLSYDSDDLSDENYRLADNDSFKSERAVEKTMDYINNTSVDYSLCLKASDANVKVNEVKSIIEAILNDPKSMSEVKELIRLMIITYMIQSKTKDVRDIDFIAFSISPKPNSKDKDIIRQREIIENWLNNKAVSYRRRKVRLQTKNSYNRALYMYFALLINEANK